MKIKYVHIENFRSIKSLNFDFPETGFLVLVGANNAGKSNIIRAINAICGEEWFGAEKMQDHDFYLRDRNRKLVVKLSFDNGYTATLYSSTRWPEYKDNFGNPIYSNKGNIKEDFPCTYLGADRSFDRHMSFYDWTLLGKIRKTFHRRCAEVADELDKKFNEIVALFDQVPGFPEFKRNLNRLRKGLRTPESAYYLPILRVLCDMGGSAKMHDVLAKVGEAMKPVLRDVDYQLLASDPDMPRWRNAAQWARYSVVKEGLLKADSPRGIWEITDAGREYLRKYGSAE
ncbi:MAG: winged helix-turn-helix domain-containing protein [Desulfotomaculales bacterium]